MSSPLYSIDILRLATDSAAFPRLDSADVTIERRAPVCGSRITVDLQLDRDGRIVAYGHQVNACALGQAASALLARHIMGSTGADLAAARDELALWLADPQARQPAWPEIDWLEPARAYPARHGAIQLAFVAAADAAARVPV
jgi:NifU-like protein involved in Fe-S cluster formation